MMKSLDILEEERRLMAEERQKKEASAQTGIQTKTDKGEPQQAAETQPEDNGAEGRTFTQAEVNKIIAERLARERSKGEPTAEDMRERELAARESRLACQEFIEQRGATKVLLDVFDTSDLSAFVAKVEQLNYIDLDNAGFGYRKKSQQEAPTKDGLVRKVFGLH